MNWIGLARSLQPEIMAATGGLLAVLIAWLVIRLSIRRSSGAGIGRAQFRKWTNGCASVLAIAIVGGMLWHVFSVISTNRLPRQDVDHSPVYERMDAIIKR